MSSPGSTPKRAYNSAVADTDTGRSGWWGSLTRGRRWLWLLLGLILIGLVTWRVVWVASQSDKPGGRFGAGGAQAVGVASASSGDMDITLNALGTVTPLATVTVRPQVSGTIVKFYFTEGQMVKTGDVLAQIDPRPFQAALDQAKGTLARDQANLNNAIIDQTRYAQLNAQKAISQQQYATQVALVQSDRGVVESDQGAVKTAAINLGFARITSPVDGRVGIRQVDIGNIVSSGQTNGIVVVTQEQPISVLFSLPEDNIGDVNGRLTAGAKLTTYAYDRGQTTLLATGTLQALDSQIDTTTGTVKARAMFDNSDGKLFPNQFVNVRLLVNTLHDQTLVPVAAVQRGAEGSYVFVVQPDKTVAQRTVTLGPGNATQVSITQGLKPGDTVVVDGADRLRDGASVQTSAAITKPSAAAGGTGAAGGGDDRAARMAKMQAVLKSPVCSADVAKYCAGKTGRDMFMCLRENRDSFSDGCTAALKKLRHAGGGGGGRHGGGGGFGG
ncbi:MAG TPA: efflux RND transporter periplasmic adaptor subunit [Rhizomicrobium sp.]|jgi:multidrug efflux system membrane fusion protein|nr:efflux RND transporter periplasmic adaptor subunit [Rhizomicrobium sp.]